MAYLALLKSPKLYIKSILRTLEAAAEAVAKVGNEAAAAVAEVEFEDKMVYFALLKYSKLISRKI